MDSRRDLIGKETKLWNAGYCTLVDFLGDDLTPVKAARMSTLNPTGVDMTKDDGLRDYLWRHHHVSPFEQCEVVFEMQIPIFIARQLIRHRVLQINEMSLRYSEPMFEYYIPDYDDVCYDSDFNKQLSGQVCEVGIAEDFINESKAMAILNKSKYDKYRKMGIAKERVRDLQPVSSMTRLVVKANLRNWYGVLQLRLGHGAQREFRELSQAIYDIIKQLYPKCSAVFEEHTLNAISLGATELSILKEFIESIADAARIDSEITSAEYLDILTNGQLSGSKKREFLGKLGL